MRRDSLFADIAFFYLVACVFSWLVELPLILGKGGLGWIKLDWPLPVVVCTATLGPLLGALFAHRRRTGNWRFVSMGNSARWIALGSVVGVLLILATFFVVFPLLLSGPGLLHMHPAAMLGLFVPMFNYNLLGGPLFEEFGWRNYLLRRLQQQLSPWLASLITGGMWAAWHLPLFLLKNWTSASPQSYLLIVTALSFLMTFGYNISRLSVVAAILMHSAFNASPQVLGAFIGNVPTSSRFPGEYVLALAFALVAVVLLLATRGRLGYPSEAFRTSSPT